MAGLLEMDAIVIKVNGSNTLESMPGLGNMCYFITQRVGMVIGFPEANVLNFNENKRRPKGLRLLIRSRYDD